MIPNQKKTIREHITPRNHTTQASRDTPFNESTYALSSENGAVDGPLEAAIHPRIEELKGKYIFHCNQSL